MSRLINAEDAITRIRKLWNKEEPLEEAYIYDDYAFGLMDAIDAVEDSPDIDTKQTEPQTYITEDRDTQILDAWQVHHRASTTAIEDEPQAERSER